jgi:hypothetical protein
MIERNKEGVLKNMLKSEVIQLTSQLIIPVEHLLLKWGTAKFPTYTHY